MRWGVRTLGIVVLLGLQQLLAPLSVRAQVPDPCVPIPIPGLCNTPPSTSPAPEPSPTTLDPTAPSPMPEQTKPPKPPKDVDGKTAEGSGKKSDKEEEPKPEDLPFAVSGPSNSARLVAILTELARYGMPLEESIYKVAGPFPVAGLAWWMDDWHAPRSGGRVHLGLDIFAQHGTPLVAAADGVVSQKGTGGLPGLYVEIQDASGTQYFYCHLSSWEPGIEVGTPVTMGQVLGYVGNTGNAINTPPHVHFEYQPAGVPQPPKPWVDSWVKLAERRALALLQEVSAKHPARTLDFRLTRLFDLAGEGGAVVGTDELLLLAGLQPAVSSLEVAHEAMDEMAWEIDWGEQANAQLSTLVDDYQSYLVGKELIGASPWPFSDQVAGALPSGRDGSD